tara:strand:- start:912 stop:1865 length:954 start_codon:yes stop_codon:yes gene_type:complete
MALTKIGSIGINTGIKFAGVTTITTLNSATDTLTIGGPVSIAGTLTYEDVTNVDSVGLITARDGIVVGSGITLSKDGDIFFTGIMTGNGSGLTGVANTDVIFTDKLQVGDSPELISVGVGSDLQIYHESNNNYINATNGTLFVRGSDLILEDAGGNDYVVCTDTGTGGSVTLKHEGSTKLVTASGGVTVTGTVAATSYTGDGSNLTGIEAGLSTASAQVSGITTVVDLSKDDIRLDCTGLVTIDTKGGSEGSNHTLRIVNSGISTVSFNSYFKFPSGGTPNLPTASGAISLISFTVHTQGRVGVASVFLAGSSVNFS